METLFQSGQQVICVDSSGEFSDGSKMPIIEGKKYTIKYPHIVKPGYAPGFVGVELFMVTGVFHQHRFLPADVDRRMENEIMGAFTTVK